ALQGDIVFAGHVAGAAQRQYVAGRAVAITDPGELHLRPFAVKVGEAEGPYPVTALAHDQIKPPTVRMNPSLQRFNLVRIESHFNVPIRLPLAVAGASLATVSRSKIDLFWSATVTDTLEGRAASTYRFFADGGRRSTIFGE